MKPLRLLDAFCGQGGATRGYQMAGFHVTGVDVAAQPRYCGDAFVQGDALEYIARHGHEYDALAASPPCQGYSAMRRLPWLRDNVYPMLIPATRAALDATGRPYIIENVAAAPLHGVILCGLPFGLKVYRHRRFESNLLLLAPAHQRHEDVIASGHAVSRRMTVSPTGFVMGGGHMSTAQRQAGEVAMQIDWMDGDGLAQAIPPAYTAYLGAQLLTVLQRQEATG